MPTNNTNSILSIGISLSVIFITLFSVYSTFSQLYSISNDFLIDIENTKRLLSEIEVKS